MIFKNKEINYIDKNDLYNSLNFLLDERERKLIRHTKMFSLTNVIWNNLECNHVRNIGYIAKVIDQFIKLYEKGEVEYTHIDFFKVYIDLYGKQFAIGFRNFQDKLQKENIYISGDKYNISDTILLFNLYYIRVIDEALIGCKREIQAYKILKKRYPYDKIYFANEYIDRHYHIDIIRETTNNIKIGYQVKSKNMHYVIFNNKQDFKNCKNDYIKSVIQYNREGQRKAKRDMNIYTRWFLIS